MSETIVKSLYETDYYAWTQEQAAALRELAERRANVPLDLANLAEEVDDLGKAERSAVRSQVRRIIEHFLKLEFSRAAYPRLDWKEAIVDARSELADKMSATCGETSRTSCRTCSSGRAERRRSGSGSSTRRRRPATCPIPAPTPWTTSSATTGTRRIATA